MKDVEIDHSPKSRVTFEYLKMLGLPVTFVDFGFNMESVEELNGPTNILSVQAEQREPDDGGREKSSREFSETEHVQPCLAKNLHGMSRCF